MALVRPDVNSFARIKVIGVGGGGSNVINSMIDNQDIKGVDFIAINTDSQALVTSQSPIKVQIGDQLTKGLGSGANPDIGRKAAEESIEKIQEVIGEADMVFITCGMGGGTGTGASPIVADVAKKSGALTVAVVTKPFLFEGTRRMVVAEEGIEQLRSKVDTLIIIPNQKLLETVDPNMSLLDSFKVSDSVLGEGVQGISDLITTPGLINVDFADVKTIMENSGTAIMGIGIASGEDKAIKAAEQAITSPLLELSIDGAKGILFNITAGKSITMNDINKAAEAISKTADTDANIIFGTAIDESLEDQIKVTVIATGFDDNSGFPQFNRTISDDNAFQNVVSEDEEFLDNDNSQQEEFLDQKDEDKEEKDLKPEEKGEEEKIVDDDDKFDIPAFLRRKK